MGGGTDPHGLPDLHAPLTKADFWLGWIGRCWQDTELGQTIDGALALHSYEILNMAM